MRLLTYNFMCFIVFSEAKGSKKTRRKTSRTTRWQKQLDSRIPCHWQNERSALDIRMRICSWNWLNCGHNFGNCVSAYNPYAHMPIRVCTHAKLDESFTITRHNMAFIAHNIVIFTMFLLAFFYRGKINHSEWALEQLKRHKAII